ncbi:MAG: hypothetical protein IJ470_04320 [Clostridia bacterium]|nr:hypothetical protein [Clostridia bacterium]
MKRNLKRIISGICAVILYVSAFVSVSAENGKVTYSGYSGTFVFEPGSEHSPTDLFPNFKDVMPGDTISQRITVKNEASNDVKVKIYLRSLGATEEIKEFLSKLSLKVENVEDKVMFNSSAEQTDGLTDWVCLGLLYSGGETDLDVTLSVPASLDNSYSSQIGYIDWEFKIEEFPVEDSDPSPSTSDSRFAPLIASVLAAACVLLIPLLVLLRKKRNAEEEEQ